MLEAFVTCVFFTSCGFGIRHLMAKADARRAFARELYIEELQDDVASLAAIVSVQTEQIHALRDESSDIIHESDMLREAVGALKAANTFLLGQAEKKATSKPKAKPVKVTTVTGNRVRVLK